MTTTMTEDEVPLDEDSPKKKKSLSRRVLDAGLSGPRWLKRYMVQHGKRFSRVVGLLLFCAIVAWWAWIVVLTYAWMWAVSQVLFWLAVILPILSLVYLYLMWRSWKKESPEVRVFEPDVSPPEPPDTEAQSRSRSAARNRAKVVAPTEESSTIPSGV